MLPFRLKFANYRSFSEPVELPFEKRITFVVGPNNSGKSNVLRFLAVLFNKANSELNDAIDFSGTSKEVSLVLDLPRKCIEEALANRPRALIAMRHTTAPSVPLSMTMTRSDTKITAASNDTLFALIPQSYFQTRQFLEDFNQSGDINQNIAMLISQMKILSLFKGTTYVPNIRFITNPGQEPPTFSSQKFAGSTIAFGDVINQLAEMDRPSYENRLLRERLTAICAFMQHVLEKRSIEIEVQADRKSIIVRIDGVPRPISNLGTGVEQSLMIGLASFGFPGKLVLIDEPELHLHPRAQKRVISYLNDFADTQFVIATHSAACLDAVGSDVVHVSEHHGTSLSTLVRSSAERYRAVRDLGHSPSELIQTRFAIWVEGPSDRIYLNHWVRMVDSDLKEGIDYSILFYGGRVLSHHGFDDVEADLVKALSLSRNLAVIIDSDRRKPGGRISSTKARVRDEVAQQEGFCWITDGREIENYIPASILGVLSAEFRGVRSRPAKHDQIVNASRSNKVEVARRATEVRWEDWPLDLKKQATELVHRIRAAQ
jgi:predicted ATPase